MGGFPSLIISIKYHLRGLLYYVECLLNWNRTSQNRVSQNNRPVWIRSLFINNSFFISLALSVVPGVHHSFIDNDKATPVRNVLPPSSYQLRDSGLHYKWYLTLRPSIISAFFSRGLLFLCLPRVVNPQRV